ncbi:MAG: exodeoxyribonuclease VII large subunit [Clostridia bacterium]
MTERELTVSQVAGYVKGIFEAEEMLHSILVVGEIASLSIVRGFAYFNLKDEESALSCVCFSVQDCPNVKNGDKVVVRGTFEFYTKGGKLNFNVSHIQIYGIGDLFQKFLQLKSKLEAKKLFDFSHKIPVPSDCKKIGVVSSKDGAVIQDIINVATRRNPSVNILLSPSKVQGNGAEFEIVKALELLEKTDVDVIILARGGGSIEDLQAFNTEVLAYAIFNCSKPIISAVGHETDFTISDFVSDLRAPTPSAAAELVTANKLAKVEHFEQIFLRLVQISSTKFLTAQTRVAMLSQLAVKNFELCTERNLQKVNQVLNILEKLDPRSILKLGYARIEKKGKLIKSVTELLLNDEFLATMYDGSVIATVKEKK